MNKDRPAYEPPKTKIYRFDDNDRILTESGTPIPDPDPEYAANALNNLFDLTTTTKETDD